MLFHGRGNNFYALLAVFAAVFSFSHLAHAIKVEKIISVNPDGTRVTEEVDLKDVKEGEQVIVPVDQIHPTQMFVGEKNVGELFTDRIKKAIDSHIREKIDASWAGRTTFNWYNEEKIKFAKQKHFIAQAADKAERKNPPRAKVDELWNKSVQTKMQEDAKKAKIDLSKLSPEELKKRKDAADHAVAEKYMIAFWDTDFRNIRNGVKASQAKKGYRPNPDAFKYPEYGTPEFSEMLSKYFNKNDLVKDYPAAVDDKGNPYLTDGHHRALLTYFAQSAMNEGGKDGPLKVTLTVNNNFSQQSDSKRQWNHYLAQMCQNHQVYFDPEVRDRVRKRVNAVLEDYKDDAKNPDMDKKLGEAIRAVFDKEVKATVKDLPHSAMRSFIGAALPNNNNSKFNFDLRNHRMGIDNSNYKDFLEFYVGENLLSLGFVFPTVDEVQLSPPRPQDKIKDPQAYDQKLKSYVITLSAMAKMKELMFGEKHSDQFREMFRKLAKPGKEEDAMKEFDKQRKIYQDSVKENIAKNPKNEKYEALIAKAGIWAKHCVTSSAAGVKPNCPPPVAGTAKLENSAQNAEQVLAKVKEPQYPKNPLTDGGTCLNPMSQTPEEMATQTELIKTVRSNVVRSRDESIQLNLDEDELAKMQKIFESGYALRNSRCVVQ